MVDLRETLVGFFTEISIIEHLARTRVERNFSADLKAGHFGILNYFMRNHPGPDSVAGIAWAFQEDEARICEQVRTLEALGYVSVVPGIREIDSMVDVTEAGRAAQEEQLNRMGPDFEQLVAEIPAEDLQTAHRVLHEIRLVMDNLPDR